MRADVMGYYKLAKDVRQAGFFETEQHKRIFSHIREAIRHGGLIAVTGMIGSGKTISLNNLKESLSREGKVIVSESRYVEKRKVQISTIIAALFYDLKNEKFFIPHGELRERKLRELIRIERKPVALFIDEAHDLPTTTLKGLKHLIETVNDRLGPANLSVILVGHPKLQNDLKRSNMEEIGYRTVPYSVDGAIDSRRQFIEWLIEQTVHEGVGVTDVFEAEAVDLLAEKLVTPLQIVEHLNRALEAGHAAGEKPITASIVTSVLSGVIEDLEATITRLGYDHKSLASLLNVSQAEAKQFIAGRLDSARASDLHEQLLVVGLPV
ncbi:MAG: AAA family ATPase [Cyanobacteriota/Melainabacteria group bacterium]